MGVFEDIVEAVENYPEEHVTLEIVNVSYAGSVLNVNEIAFFQVDIRNSGPLHMEGVTVRLEGLHGAQVRAQGVFEDVSISDVYPVVAGHRPDLAHVLELPFNLLAPNEPDSQVRNLVKATLEDWNLEWGHPLKGHSDPTDAVIDKWASDVQPKT